MIGTVMVPMLLLPRHWFRQFVITWSAGNGMLLRIIAGVHSEIRNREHRPTGAAIIASKHQSEWEAHVFLHELDDPAYVIKRELSFVPGYGWFSAKVNMIFVDREGGAKSLRGLVRGAQKAVARGRPVVIFPEGTRVMPGEKLPYRPGVAALYSALDVPVVPVVLNSGMHWPKGSFRRYPRHHRHGVSAADPAGAAAAGLHGAPRIDDGRGIAEALRRTLRRTGGGSAGTGR